MRFVVYKHILPYKGTLVERYFIAIRDFHGGIVVWTDFHRYAISPRTALSKSVSSSYRKNAQSVCLLLNYVFFDMFHITSLLELTADMVKSFLHDYGLCRLPSDNFSTHRNEQTVNRCVAHIFCFLTNLAADKPCKVKLEELYIKKTVFSKARKRYVTKMVPAFDIFYKNDVTSIVRDITEEAFQILFTEIYENHQNLLMLAALGAFAGLRPSECCNVRRPDSPLGPGIIFELTDGTVTNVFIDLTKKICLRSDVVSVGGIKKPRMQKVYPAFLDAFLSCYNKYMEYIEGRRYESAYGALTNNQSGKAFTYDSYLKTFKAVVTASIPKMLASEDPKTILLGHLILEHGLAPHIFRHWFSVKLTLYGENIPGLMYWRGDRNPESALTYLQNKSMLTEEFSAVNERIFDFSLWKAGKIYDR